MKCKPLKDVAQIIMGQSPDSSSYNEVGEGLPFFQGNADFGVMYPSERIWCNQPKKIANENDILISVRAPIGALNYANKKCCIGRGLAAITVNNPVERNYIFHLLKAKNAELNRKGTGSTFKAIGKNVLEDIPVPIVSSEIQLHITRLMDITESIISKRKNELKYYDELIKARFVEMFGDPVNNSKGWNNQVLKSVCIKITDGEHGSVERVKEGHPFLNAKHIKSTGDIDWANVTYTPDEVHERIYKRCNPESGDVMMTTTGTIGNVAVVPCGREPFTMDRGITLLKLDSTKVQPLYIAWLLRHQSIQAIMNSKIHASAIGHLFLNKVEKIPVIVPDMESQNAFSNFVAQIDKSKVAVQKSLNQAQLLFDSLMQQYFG